MEVEDVIVAAVETAPGNVKHSAFEPEGYHFPKAVVSKDGTSSTIKAILANDVAEPIVIPFDNLVTVTVEEGRFEKWTIEARNADGKIVSTRAMREQLR